jgi:cytochrome c
MKSLPFFAIATSRSGGAAFCRILGFADLGILPLMKLKSILVFGIMVLTGGLTPAQNMAKSISGIVTTRLVTPDDRAVVFLLTNPGAPTVPVFASGADAAALVPRNQITLSGAAASGAFGAGVQVTAGSVSVTDTNQPFKSQTIGAANFKDAQAWADVYVQLTNVTFTGDKFDASGTAMVKAGDGAMVTLLVSKGAFGRTTPRDATDVFGVVVRNSGEWRLVAARFLPVNRKDLLALATKDTCITCHNPDTKIVGPAYRDVAASYRNDPDAAAKIITQMQNGGSGKWGAVPMPALKATVPADDMPKLAGWILGYRWDTILAE